MSAYLQRLKQLSSDNLLNTPYIELTKPTKPPEVPFYGSTMGHIEKNKEVHFGSFGSNVGSVMGHIKRNNCDDFINTPSIELTKPTEVPFGSNVGSVMGHIEKNKPDSEITNHWWLLQFKDGETRQACTWPHSTKAEMLKLNPDAVTAEPIPSPID